MPSLPPVKINPGYYFDREIDSSAEMYSQDVRRGRKILFNYATEEDLCSVPGIGPVKAKRLLEVRSLDLVKDSKELEGCGVSQDVLKTFFSFNIIENITHQPPQHVPSQSSRSTLPEKGIEQTFNKAPKPVSAQSGETERAKNLMSHENAIRGPPGATSGGKHAVPLDGNNSPSALMYLLDGMVPPPASSIAASTMSLTQNLPDTPDGDGLRVNAMFSQGFTPLADSSRHPGNSTLDWTADRQPSQAQKMRKIPFSLYGESPISPSDDTSYAPLGAMNTSHPQQEISYATRLQLFGSREEKTAPLLRNPPIRNVQSAISPDERHLDPRFSEKGLLAYRSERLLDPRISDNRSASQNFGMGEACPPYETKFVDQFPRSADFYERNSIPQYRQHRDEKKVFDRLPSQHDDFCRDDHDDLCRDNHDDFCRDPWPRSQRDYARAFDQPAQPYNLHVSKQPGELRDARAFNPPAQPYNLNVSKQPGELRDDPRAFGQLAQQNQQNAWSGPQRIGRMFETLPKNISYNGKTTWSTFRDQFTMFLDSRHIFQHDIVMSYFSQALTGAALDHFHGLARHTTFNNIEEVFSMMEDRFGDKKHVGSALMQFFAMTQEENEPIEAWAARIRDVARQAYPERDPTWYEEQVTVKFSMGLFNRNAAMHVCCQNPKSVREAVQAYHIFMYAENATGTSLKQTILTDPFSVCAVKQTPTQAVKNPAQEKTEAVALQDKALTSVLEQINSQITQICRKQDKGDKFIKETKETLLGLDQRLKNMEADTASLKKNRGKSVSFRSRKSTPSPKKPCFNCGGIDHWSRECPNPPKQSVSRVRASDSESHDDELSDAGSD